MAKEVVSTIDEKYFRVKNAGALLKDKEELQEKLIEAWSAKYFKEICNLGTGAIHRYRQCSL